MDSPTTPKMPLFDSNDPSLGNEVSKQFGSGALAPREETVVRLRVAAHEAEQNVVRMSRRKKYDSAQYYAGRRDGLRLAIEMLERES